jgi:hypothetical protein
LRRFFTAFEVDFLKSVRWAFTVAALFAIGHAFAATEDDEVDSDRDFELPGADVAETVGDGGLDLKDVDFVGSPLKKLAGRWPEDLVIAPIPGRSPQLGWKLTLAGGYFLESRDEDSEVAPSLLGGFAMVAENGSYAYGGGANLHLLDDKLRVKAGAGYMDVRYRFYGIGNDAGVSGIGADILQEGPMYFASASWRVWNKLYVGLGYLGGEVETRLRFLLDPDRLRHPGSRAIPAQRLARQRACNVLPRVRWRRLRCRDLQNQRQSLPTHA